MITTTHAICARYLEGECFPYQTPGFEQYHKCDDTLYECWQPDCIEDDEFNLIILIEGMPVKARGIHFDFIEVEV